MNKVVVRMSDLASTKSRRGLLPVSSATLWRWVAGGAFPKPFKLGPGTTVWYLADVEAWIAAHSNADAMRARIRR